MRTEQVKQTFVYTSSTWRENTHLWHGNDLNKATCIFEQNLLIRYLPNRDLWECVYRLSDDRFGIGLVDARTFVEFPCTMMGKRYLSDFMANCCSTWDEWLGLPMLRKIDDFVGFFGDIELFGEEYFGGYTTAEICKKLRIKYKREYERE